MRRPRAMSAPALDKGHWLGDVGHVATRVGNFSQSWSKPWFKPGAGNLRPAAGIGKLHCTPARGALRKSKIVFNKRDHCKYCYRTSQYIFFHNYLSTICNYYFPISGQMRWPGVSGPSTEQVRVRVQQNFSSPPAGAGSRQRTMSVGEADRRVVHSEMEELISELWELNRRLYLFQSLGTLIADMHKVKACIPFGIVFTVSW